MRFLYKLVFKQDAEKKLMINVITCSMLDSPSTSDDNDMNTGVSKSTSLEPTIKKWTKEKNSWRLGST